MAQKGVLEILKNHPAAALTLLTSVSYFCTFQYERGICSIYRIPSEYIEIGLSNILSFASYTAIFFALFLLVSSDLFMTTAELIDFRSDNWFKKYNYIVGYVLGFLSILINSFVFTITFGVMAFFVLFYQWYRGFIINILISSEASEIQLIKKAEWKAIKIRARLRDTTALLLALLLLPVLSFKAGIMTAEMKSEYQILIDKPNTFLLRKYGENFIFRTRSPNKTIVLLKHQPKTFSDFNYFYLKSIKNIVFGLRIQDRWNVQLYVIKHGPQYPILLRDTSLRYTKPL